MWLTLIVAETIAANSGIGYMAMHAREFMLVDVVVLAIVIYALLGKLADSSVRPARASDTRLAPCVSEEVRAIHDHCCSKTGCPKRRLTSCSSCEFRGQKSHRPRPSQKLRCR